MTAVLTTLTSFGGFIGDGGNPVSGLIMDANGDLFGTTFYGGASATGGYPYGTVFEIAKTATGYSGHTILVSFDPTTGIGPFGSLVMDANGDLFGTTTGSFAGTSDHPEGTVFEIVNNATGYASTPTTIVSFNGTDGSTPFGNLLIDATGDLFGTTSSGGTNGVGTVFEIANSTTPAAPAASGYTPTTLTNFNLVDNQPHGGVIMDANGNLFGTTTVGGTYSGGTVYEIVKTPTGYASTPFILASLDFNSTPYSGLTMDAAGNLFGTTTHGGAYGFGSVFEVAKTATGYASTQTILASFGNSDGAVPMGGLIIDAAGNLFGTTASGGTIGNGTVFEIAKNAGVPTTLVNFAGINPGTIGGVSYGNLIADADGNLFGTTYYGGTNGQGTVFEITGSGFVPAATAVPDPGPTAGDLTTSANLGQTIDLTAAIMAKITPGLAGDTETLTTFGATSAGGLVALINGDLTYGAQANGTLAHIPANGSVVDTFTYTVTDQLNNKATGSVSVTVNNPAVVIEGSLKGGSTIRGGSQTNIVNAHGSGNTIIESGGNDVVNAGTGSATVTTGSGDVVVNLSGKNNTVNGGNGNITVNMQTSSNSDVKLGSGTDSIIEAAGSKGGNTFILTGSHASLTLYGANDVAFIHSGTDAIADHTQGLEVKVGKEGGVIDLTGFGADKTGFIDLVGGIGGFKTPKAVVAALQSDGHGGTLLSFGAAGHIDFVGVAVGTLKAASFQIG